MYFVSIVLTHSTSFLFLGIRPTNQTGANGEPDRQLLDSVWGEVPKRMTTAIMGPSGAGELLQYYILFGQHLYSSSIVHIF